MSALSYIVAFLMLSASMAAPVDLDAVVPETYLPSEADSLIEVPPKLAAGKAPPVLVEQEGVKKSGFGDVKHALLGVLGQTCHYELDMDLNEDISGESGGSTPRHDTKKMKGAYTIAVTPASIHPSGVLYHIQGHHLIFREQQMAQGRQDSKNQDFTNTFSKCYMEVFQQHGTGAVHPSVLHKKRLCPDWMSNLLAGSITVLTPVFHNTAKSKALEFSLVENTDVFGKYQRKMAYSSKEETDGSISVIGHGTALVQKDAPGQTSSKEEETKMITDSASQTHKVSPDGNIESVRVGGTVKTGDTTGEAPQSMVPDSEKTEPVAQGVVDEEDRPMESTQTISTSVSAQKHKCFDAASTPTHETTSVEELLEQKVKSGYSVMSNFVERPHDLQHIADLPSAARGQAVTKMATTLASMKRKAAHTKAASLMELKPIRDEVIEQILKGRLTGHHIAHQLLNALGTQLIHSKTSTKTAKEVAASLVLVASRDSLPIVTREQAIYALVHDQCHDHKLVIDALDSLVTDAKVSGEIGEFALQVQHGLMRSQAACSSDDDKQHILSSHADRLARTETLLQKAVKNGKFMSARVHLTALGNSRFARHADAVANVLKNADLPDHLHYGAVKVLGLLETKDHQALLGEYVHHHDKWTATAARDAWNAKFPNQPWPSEQSLLQEKARRRKAYPKVNKGKKSGKTPAEFCAPQELNEKKEWPLPKTGDFQAVGGVETGIGMSGAKAEAYAGVQLYGTKYKVVSLVAEKQGLGLCSAGKPAILELKLASMVVFKRQYGKKSTKSSAVGKAYKKAGFEALETPLDTSGFCMTNLEENSCLSGEKLWSKTFFEKTFRTWVGPVPLSASIKLSGEWGLTFGIGMLDECDPDSKDLAMIQDSKSLAMIQKNSVARKIIKNRNKIATGAKLAARVWERIPTSLEDVEQMAIDALNYLIRKAATSANLGIEEESIPDLAGFTNDDVKQFVDDVIASAKTEAENWLSDKSGGYITMIPTDSEDFESMFLHIVNKFVKDSIESSPSLASLGGDFVPELHGWSGSALEQWGDDLLSRVMGEFLVGDVIDARWNGGAWYKGVISAKTGTGSAARYSIDYDDDSKESDVEGHLIRGVHVQTHYAVGDSVQATYNGGSVWYPATVRAKAGTGSATSYSLDYDDGDTSTGQDASEMRRVFDGGAENVLIGAINKKLGTSFTSIPRDKEGWAAAAGAELSKLTDGVIDTVPLTVEGLETEIKNIAARMAAKIWSKVEPVLVRKINAELGLHLDTIPLDAAGWKEVAGKELSILTGGIIEMVPTTEAELQEVIKQATTKLAAKHLPAASQCVDEDTGYKFNGVLAMISPYAKADLAMEAAIDAYVVKAGIGAEVELLSINLPVTMEACLFGDCANQCFDPQVETSAGGGRAYLFIKTIWSDQDEWDVFNWDGASWLWPAAAADDSYKGFCTGAVDTGPPPPPPPALKETDCVVDIYEDEHYGGKLLKTCNTNQMDSYWCRVKNGGGVENEASSYKMSGWCNKFQVIDEDNCGGSDDVTYYASTPDVPWDLDDDTCGVKIWAAGALVLFGNDNFSGWRSDFKEGNYEHNSFVANGATNDATTSLKVRKGCKAILYQHGDFAGWHLVVDATNEQKELNHNHFVSAGGVNDDVSSVKVACGVAANDLQV